MVEGNREQNIKKVIKMEDRILECDRCSSALPCVRRPTLGKGDLVPEAILVFETEHPHNFDFSKVLEIRKVIAQELYIKEVYHTFLIRCQPRSCAQLTNSFYRGDRKLLGKDHNCIISNDKCNGIPIKPNYEQTIACLPYLIEEIEILSPPYIFLFGDLVAEFVLKAWGFFDEFQYPSTFSFNNAVIFIIDYEDKFDANYCQQLIKLKNKA